MINKDHLSANSDNHSKKLLYNNTADKLYKGSLGRVEIVTGWDTKYVIEYCNHVFEFYYSQLLDAVAFNKKCLAVGLPIIDFWVPFINEAISKAVLIPDNKYKPNIVIAQDYCTLLRKKGELTEKEGFYYVPIYNFYRNGIGIEDSLFRRLLEDYGIKVGEDRDNWKLDPVKLQEFVGE